MLLLVRLIVVSVLLHTFLGHVLAMRVSYIFRMSAVIAVVNYKLPDRSVLLIINKGVKQRLADCSVPMLRSLEEA